MYVVSYIPSQQKRKTVDRPPSEGCNRYKQNITEKNKHLICSSAFKYQPIYPVSVQQISRPDPSHALVYHF